MIDTTAALNDILVPFLLAAAAAGVKWLRDWLKLRLAPGQVNLLRVFAEQAVVAAEKLGLATGIRGPEKYAYAEQALIAAARRVGLRVTAAEANALIHSTLAALDDVFGEPQAQAAA